MYIAAVKKAVGKWSSLAKKISSAGNSSTCPLINSPSGIVRMLVNPARAEGYEKTSRDLSICAQC